MEVEQYLRLFVNHCQSDWSEWLPLAEFAYNNRVHSSTRRSPFEVDTGRHPRMGVEPRRTSRVEAADDFAQRMAKTLEETRSALKLAADDMARFYDVDHQEAEVFEVGDKVWLDGRNIKTDRPTKKLDDRWFGPFQVTKAHSRNAYRLKLTPGFAKIYPVFHVSFIVSNLIRSQRDPAEPVIVDGEPEYEVDKILDSKLLKLVTRCGWMEGT